MQKGSFCSSIGRVRISLVRIIYANRVTIDGRQRAVWELVLSVTDRSCRSFIPIEKVLIQQNPIGFASSVPNSKTQGSARSAMRRRCFVTLIPTTKRNVSVEVVGKRGVRSSIWARVRSVFQRARKKSRSQVGILMSPNSESAEIAGLC
jgi:hypothetical protein